MEVIIVLFFLFLVSSLGESKKKAKQKRQAEQRVFRQMQEELEREQAEAARRMSAGEGEQHQPALESEAAKRVAQAAAHQAVEAEIYRQVAFAHATEESSACTEDWQEEVRLHARPRPMGNRPMENKTPQGAKRYNPYAKLFTAEGVRNGIILSEVLGTRGGRFGKRIGR